MRKLSVPYTINRRGVYYLNLRWNNQFIRQSLATKDPMEAFQKVSQLAPILSNPEACEQILRQTVSEMAGSGARLRGYKNLYSWNLLPHGTSYADRPMPEVATPPIAEHQ